MTDEALRNACESATRLLHHEPIERYQEVIYTAVSKAMEQERVHLRQERSFFQIMTNRWSEDLLRHSRMLLAVAQNRLHGERLAWEVNRCEQEMQRYARAIVDATWQEATESEAVPGTPEADRIIASVLPPFLVYKGD